MHGGQAGDAVNLIVKRHTELFGSIATARAAIRLMRTDGCTAIIKCRLEQVDSIFTAIALADPPAVTLGNSGSIKQLLTKV